MRTFIVGLSLTVFLTLVDTYYWHMEISFLTGVSIMACILGGIVLAVLQDFKEIKRKK